MLSSRNLIPWVFALAVGTLATPCSGAQAPSDARQPEPSTRSSAIAQRLYVGNYSASTVLVYRNDAHPMVIGTITKGISGPAGMSVDPGGNLYVADSNGADVTVYRPGTTVPFFTITAGLTRPSSVAIGNDGTVYVTDFAGEVQEYRAGATQPFLTIPPIPANSSPSASNTPTDVAVDAAGDIDVFYDYEQYIVSSGFVVEYPHGQTVGQTLANITTTHGGGIDLDRAGNIALAWPGSSRAGSGVAIYAAGTDKRLEYWGARTNPSQLRLGAHEDRVYTADSYVNVIRIYTYPEGRLIRKISLPPDSSSFTSLAVAPAHVH